MGITNPNGYSATVRIWLQVGHQRVPLTHTSSTFVIAREASELPAGDAQIIFEIDDTPYVRDVTLVQGMKSPSREAMVVSRDGIAPF
jgi:hypothetical protein